ncbi:hypothetical protein EVAR_98502_1 [Eumeta japonica]|uniref:Uncharacterized protein n=1 Tax=Eumeta variegata TaxID=151549 RepID=A0A4C2ABQ1_EUMVA|nr:hypothetical protein EVAR_98502_1 [Eumeta japonica]
MRRLHSSVDSVGSRIRMQVTNFLVDPLLPRRTSAQVFIRTVVPRASTTCPFLTTGLSAHLIDVSSLARLCSFCALLYACCPSSSSILQSSIPNGP